MIRNEVHRLPWFLSYYRRLGVTRFFIVDNNSNDGTQEFLLANSDVHLFSSKASFKTSEFGSVWREVLFRKYGHEHWCLVVDPDEMFIYPGYENIDLHALIAKLEAEKCLGLEAIWVQMYSGEPIRKTVLKPNMNPLELCPYFDADSAERGPHPRLLDWTFTPNKAPLLYLCNGGPRVWVGAHRFIWKSGGPRREQIAKMRGAVLHFKFTSDLHEKCQEEICRRQHWNSEAKYGGFFRKMMEDPDLTLTHEGSTRYENSEQLVCLGIMKVAHSR